LPAEGARVSNKSLTIVLPVYNGESRLTHHVTEMLELASELTSRFEVMIVDDGSTDETSAVAQELATQFPQISVRRHRHRRGLGPIISMVQRRVSTDVVIVHDGVTPINPVEVRRLWQQSAAEAAQPVSSGRTVSTKVEVKELAGVRATHTAMALAHERVLGFHLLQPIREEDALGQASTSSSSEAQSPKRPRPTNPSGVGMIPPLPRPNFLSAVADFALGE
jgi:glycosyltransferase involved in cell wall biosynthesis